MQACVFPNFPQFCSQYLYFTDSTEYSPLSQSTLISMHTPRQTHAHTLAPARTHTHADTRRFNFKILKKKKKRRRSRAELSDAPVQLSCVFPAGTWRMPVTALSHTHPCWGHPLCNLISGYWLSLLSLTSHKVSPGLMSLVSIAMG